MFKPKRASLIFFLDIFQFIQKTKDMITDRGRVDIFFRNYQLRIKKIVQFQKAI